MQLLQRNKKTILLFIIFFVGILPALIGLFHPGFFVSDDGNWMVIRFSAFYEALRHGQFPVRFLPRLLNGYGYPVADFLYPLFMYLGVPIRVIGFNFVTTIKILFGLSLIFSGIFSFFWQRKKFEIIPAFIGAFVYIYFPYHLFDLYRRGSMGEVLAMSIVPFILWQIERKSVLLVGFGIGLLILAHNTLAIMFLPVLAVYYFLSQKNMRNLGLSLLVGLGMTTFFWIPALFDKQYTVFDSVAVSQFNQYFLNVQNGYIWGFVGLVSLILSVWSISRRNVTAIFFALVLLISLFLALPISYPLWHSLPLGKYVQFPFRFVSLAIMSSSFLVSYGYSSIQKKYQTAYTIIVGLAIILSAIPTLFPTNYQMYPDSWYSTNQDSTTVHNEYLPVWVDEIPTNKTQVAQVIKGNGILTSQLQNSSNIKLNVSMNRDSILQINTIYFPGWVVKVDGKTTSIVYANKFGLMEIAMPKGVHDVTASFTETPVRLVADVISLLVIVISSILALIQYKHR